MPRVTIKIAPMNELLPDLGFCEELNLFTANTVKKYIDKYTPYKTGATMKTAKLSADDDLGYIEYTTPYSARIYNGVDFNFKKTVHPLARAEWDKGLTEPEIEEIIKKIDSKRKRLAKSGE